MTKFQCSYAPEVSILAYLERIKKYARCSNCCFAVALTYIDRVIETGAIVLSSLNVHRLLITSIMLAAKFLDDLFYNNAFYAKLGGVSVTEINALEIEFLKLINFSLYVSPEVYSQYNDELLRFATATKQAPSVTLPLPSPPNVAALYVSTSPLSPFSTSPMNPTPSISPVSVSGHLHLGYFSAPPQSQSTTCLASTPPHVRNSQLSHGACCQQPMGVASVGYNVMNAVQTPPLSTWEKSLFEQSSYNQNREVHMQMHKQPSHQEPFTSNFGHLENNDRDLVYSHRYQQEEQNYSFLVARQYPVTPVGSY